MRSPGFRIGYAIVPDGGPDLSPVLGVGTPALAAARWAVENGAESPRRQARAGRRAAARLAAEFPVADGVGPYAWLALPVAEELAARRIYVAPGSAWGDEATCASRCTTTPPPIACSTRYATSRPRSNKVLIRAS